MARMIGILALATVLWGSSVTESVAQAGSAGMPAVAVGPQYDTTLSMSIRRTSIARGQPPGDVRRHDVEARVFTVTPTRAARCLSSFSLPSARSLSSASRRLCPTRSGPSGQATLSPTWTWLFVPRAPGADLIVAPFNDPIGRDAIIQWPGGVNMQLYWHTTPRAMLPWPRFPRTGSTCPPIGPMRSSATSSRSPKEGRERRRNGSRVRLAGRTRRTDGCASRSLFGKVTVLVTDGHLPYPYGREFTGYEVADLDMTLAKAKAAGSERVGRTLFFK
jgi:hypothetical protein